MRALLVFVAILAVGCAEIKRYDGYKVYKIFLTEDTTFVKYEIDTIPGVHVLDMPRIVGKPGHVMVPPGPVDAVFRNVLEKHDIYHEVLVEDVENVFRRERFEQYLATRRSLPEGRISFNAYQRHSEINAYLDQLASEYPKVASVINIGKSSEGRDMNVLKLSTGGSGSRPAILVDAGIHAREWISPAMALYIIQQLAENKTNSNLINKLDWYILPVVNPDGYEYTFTTDRMWRKTRSKNGALCTGTDANRNFGFHWNEIGASDNPCADIYAGPTSFSEPETVALREFALKVNRQVKLYLTLHSYGNYLLYPWGYTSDLPSDADELHSLGLSVNKALGNKYTVGSSTNVLYPAAGGSDDWFKGVAGVDLSYTIELPSGGSGFDPPPSKIKPIVTETWSGIEVYANYIINKFS